MRATLTAVAACLALAVACFGTGWLLGGLQRNSVCMAQLEAAGAYR